MLVEPAPGEKTGQAVASGRRQAREGALQQLGVERHRACTTENANPEQAEKDAAELGQGHRLAEEQRANQHTHQRRGGIEDRRVTGWQHLGRH
ncbi:hypothetical protein D3C80_1176300 [compost metagenome]